MKKANYEPITYSDVHIEPTSNTFMDAARFLSAEGPFAALVSLGGGSSMDTSKAAILYACHPPPEVENSLYLPLKCLTYKLLLL